MILFTIEEKIVEEASMKNQDSEIGENEGNTNDLEVNGTSSVPDCMEEAGKRASINRMKELTHASESDCVRYLEKSNYDHEAAISDYYNNLSLR